MRRGDVRVASADRVELGAPPPPPFPEPLRLVHEDDDLIVVDKPPGLLTIADEGERQRTAYRLLQGELLDFSHRGEPLALTLSAPVQSRAI